MARSRINKADSWLPSRVYRGKSSYEYRPVGSGAIVLMRLVRKDGEIFEPPEVKRRLLEAYESAIKIKVDSKNVDYWLTRFFLSSRFLRLSIRSQQDYTRYCECKANGADPRSRNGVRVVLGHMMPSKVKTHHIRRYMDYWAAAGKEVTANRHLSFLQTFFGWVREQNAGVELNPAHKVTKFKEESRAVYIEDDDYQKLLKAAYTSSSPYVAAAMEITYLCGLRRGEVLKLNMDDISEEGLFIRRGKGSKNEVTEISLRLQAALDFAISLHSNRTTLEPLKNRPLLRLTRVRKDTAMPGQRVTATALHNAWRKIRISAGLEKYTFHDLKKKAGTDGKDLGHKTKAMADMYDLKPKVKSPTK